MRKLTQNQWLYIIMAGLFQPAMVFLSINTVFSYFLIQLDAPSWVLGVMGALAPLASFITQPFFADRSSGLTRRAKAFSRILYVQRIVLLGFVLLIPLLYRLSVTLLIVCFVAIWTFFNMIVGSYAVFSIPLYRKTIPAEAFGRQQAMGQLAGQLTALAATVVLGKVLSGLPMPYNYMLLFGLGGFLLFLEATMFLCLDEPADESAAQVPQKKTPLGEIYADYVRSIPVLWREDKRYFIYIGANMIMVSLAAALPFFTQYMVTAFGAADAQVSLLTTVYVSVGIAGALVMSFITDSIGPGRIVRFAPILYIAAAALLLVLRRMEAVYIAYALSYLGSLCYSIPYYAVIVKYAPAQKLPAYVSIYTLCTLAASSLCSLLFSACISLFGSYMPMFILIAVLGAAAVIAYRCFFRGQSSL